MPARYIFLLTFCVKFSFGLFGKIRPPPRHSGDDVMPARARPVPFWRHGFLVECLTVGTVLLCAGALAGIGLECDHDLMHQRFVVVAREHGVGCIDLRRGLALIVEELELHQLAPFFALTLTAGRTTTWPFFAPGTAPRTSSSWRASSTRTTSRFCVVVVSSPR